MPVQHKFDPSEKTLLITISGDFNFDVNASFREAYRNIAPAGISNVAVNLNKATYMDSSALGMLLLLDEHFEDVQISLEQCPDYIQSVLQIANFDQKFSVS
jgi:HptB-dependent secretion and biofilm anti anti-sigma factor